ncbi:Hypothetical protein CulFRC11_0090 [Corynebacterium ramonii]|uniref:Uncharacterized protein n=1 Tax=Corynebacterium ramonii TaxID=3026968 RepID=A0ABM5RP64_9CORY|nr:Hypothetical protein CulFRC11_0090 [Corynebacterium ramonii FRC0011]ESU59425.1 hypothetical protein D881_00915 [Corynebacterium ulcerans NCTC 12077]
MFRKISRSLLIVTAAFSLTVASAPSAFAATVTAQCQVIKIGLGGDVVGHVYGNASTLNGAKRDANKYVPPAITNAIVKESVTVSLDTTPKAAVVLEEGASSNATIAPFL